MESSCTTLPSAHLTFLDDLLRVAGGARSSQSLGARGCKNTAAYVRCACPSVKIGSTRCTLKRPVASMRGEGRASGRQ
jgi:hypothetical protein